MRRPLTGVAAATLLLTPALAGSPAAAQPNWQPGFNQGNQIRCDSRNFQYARCPVPTFGQVQLVQQFGNQPCIEGRSWGYDRGSVWVDNGCRALFLVGGGGGFPGYPGGTGGYYPPPGGGGNWGRNYAGQIACESWNYTYNRCPVPTNGRVDLIEPIAGTCRQGSSWGYDSYSIWVNNGCRAQFGFGYGQNSGGGGNSGGGAVAGVAIAAGLIALLAAAGKSNNRSDNNQGVNVSANAPPAAITADLSRLPANQRASVQTCLNEAARQVGATGGTRIALERAPQVSRIADGWAVRAQLTGTYPGQVRSAPISCRANNEHLQAFDFTSS